ncbi:hypothetical protein BEP19_05300 [Ammoniphilus oxalaticus]|uniref:Uncharacterized protein n=1 Tax=Ammoniphilus oxalaticus TaxID=66863 RepID=A0A419SIQ8_9BACL|nr:hypothetical protein [Ammoniphilus oxalaticus]RKD23847.1 hypothetical protein BEP19_05300 [Ammoniphilus oxalaticus]
MKKEVQTWFKKEVQKSGLTEPPEGTPFFQKWVAFSLLFSAPIALSGCGSQQLTAEDECKWERDRNGKWELDCDNNNSSYYRGHGYASKDSPIRSSSPMIKQGVGSGGKKSGGFFSGG